MSATPNVSNTPLIPGYVMHKLLGQGGMATVYLATQEKLKREVALKVISPQHAMDAEFRDRFISEGQLTARLYHRHIMTVFDIGEAGGNFFMATEVLSGGTLDERLPTIHSVVDKLLILREVAEGLGFAHSHQIIHRDIKPGNILFRADGTAVVADFGIAKALDMTRAQTLAGMIVGTPSYMSPEQVQGQPLDGRSDLYSLASLGGRQCPRSLAGGHHLGRPAPGARIQRRDRFHVCQRLGARPRRCARRVGSATLVPRSEIAHRQRHSGAILRPNPRNGPPTVCRPRARRAIFCAALKWITSAAASAGLSAVTPLRRERLPPGRSAHDDSWALQTHCTACCRFGTALNPT